MSAVGFGNSINDIMDVKSDTISHPRRPLPQNMISRSGAILFSFFCASFSLANAYLVSPFHALAVFIPLVMLSLYAFFFKATPLVGNVLVSCLVAYPLLFGGLHAPGINRLIVPASLAFLLNMAREIIKDLEDEEGDKKSGILTTAALPEKTLKAAIVIISGLYMAFLFVPFFIKHFGIVYFAICAVIALPLHLWWSTLAISKTWRFQLAKISSLIKLEMIAGLVALAADQAIKQFVQ
jgi:geranylgeranylglycerol-phosphate geranylgeranyltransferase